MNVEELFATACSGDIDALKKYYEIDRGEANLRHDKFGSQHSLIMGAFRNDQFSTVEYLLSVGETITDEERQEILKGLKRLAIMKKLGDL